MRTKLIRSKSEECRGYGEDGGDTERYEYECPCGKGFIFEEHDNVPGSRDHYAYIACKECNKKYFLDMSKGVRYWELKKIKND